jgi:hypothetical protein
MQRCGARGFARSSVAISVERVDGGRGATERTVAPGSERGSPKAGVSGVEADDRTEPSPIAREDAQDLVRGEAADHAAERSDDPSRRAVRRVSGRQVFEKASVTRQTVGSDDCHGAGPPHRRRVDDRDRACGEVAPVCQQKTGGEVVGAIEHDIDRRESGEQRLRQRAPHRLDLSSRRLRGGRGGGALQQPTRERGRLGLADIRLRIQDLSVQIACLDFVVVGHEQTADARRPQRERRRIADPASADDQDGRIGERGRGGRSGSGQRRRRRLVGARAREARGGGHRGVGFRRSGRRG